MTDKAKRNKRRGYAKEVSDSVIQICPECGEKTHSGHYVSIPQTLEDVVFNAFTGFWVCPRLYDDNGGRKQ